MTVISTTEAPYCLAAMYCLTFIALLLFTVSPIHAQKIYKVIALRASNSPILSKSTGSAWDFNYNAALFENNGNLSLIVRSQNLKNSSIPFEVGPSFLSSSQISFNASGFPSTSPAKDPLLDPNNDTELCGMEDPRVAQLNGMLYLTYTAYNCSNAMLSAAIATDAGNPGIWNRRGFVFPGKNWSKSGAMLFATPENRLRQ